MINLIQRNHFESQIVHIVTYSSQQQSRKLNVSRQAGSKIQFDLLKLGEN
jgi:hypothetical protein